MLNRYPYAAGHLMVAPHRHLADPTELEEEESREMMSVLQLACRALREVSRPEGINVGMNLGEAAGAGIRDHLHMHVVPRWNGDSSFMAVLDDVRVIPEHILSTYDRLAPAFASLAVSPQGARSVS
jgi:ATP adenylyltransferase